MKGDPREDRDLADPHRPVHAPGRASMKGDPREDRDSEQPVACVADPPPQ